jgi:hypothetical protein
MDNRLRVCVCVTHTPQTLVVLGPPGSGKTALVWQLPAGCRTAGHSAVTGDLDADGRLDVLSASCYDNKIAWYRNGGGSPPTWTPYTISMTADYARSVFAADTHVNAQKEMILSWYA